jgi:hypothetical protein
VTLATIAAVLVLSAPAPPREPAGVQAFWDRVAQCETGGDWRWGSQFASPTYEGGVGFASSTWRGLVSGAKFGGVPSPFARLARFFPHAFNAPRLWQIALAQWLYLRGGYWGCLQ